MSQKIKKLYRKKKRKDCSSLFSSALAPPPLKLTLAYRAGDSHGNYCLLWALSFAHGAVASGSQFVASWPKKVDSPFSIIKNRNSKQRKKNKIQKSLLATFHENALTVWIILSRPNRKSKRKKINSCHLRVKRIIIPFLFQVHRIYPLLNLKRAPSANTLVQRRKKRDCSLSFFPFRQGNEKKK